MKYLILILLLSSCVDKIQKPQSRIKVIEEKRYLSIVQVDSVEYFVNYHGGIVPLVKK